MSKEKTQECPGCRHYPMDYMRWHREAERRNARGEKQVQCPVCGLWCWPDELVQTKDAPS